MKTEAWKLGTSHIYYAILVKGNSINTIVKEESIDNIIANDLSKKITIALKSGKSYVLNYGQAQVVFLTERGYVQKSIELLQKDVDSKDKEVV